jgi:hypothetical protein
VFVLLDARAFFLSRNLQMITPELFAKRIAELKAIVADIKRRTPSVPLTMPTIDRKRRDFMQLMPAHLAWVEEIGLMIDYDRSELHDFFMQHYDKLFPPLRRSVVDRDVPADRLRRHFIISRLLDLCEMRRAEYSDRTRREVARRFNAIPESQRFAPMPPDVSA